MMPLSFSIFDELVKTVPGVVVLVLSQVVVENLVNGFDVRLYGVADDISYALGHFILGVRDYYFSLFINHIPLKNLIDSSLCSVCQISMNKQAYFST